MIKTLLTLVPPDVVKIGLTLAIAFFVGLEREEHKQREAGYAFGGVRSFPLLGLSSYALALLSGPYLVPWAVGLAVVGVLMALSYQHKLALESPAGLTTEISAIVTYVVGGLVQREDYWIATTLGVVSVLLLDLKKGLEGLTRYAASNEIVTVAKFLVLAAVVLPVVPDKDLTRFHLNPFQTWLVVVAVSGVSFASWLLQRALKARGGVMLSALLGGAYSSTVTTVVLARQSKGRGKVRLYAGSILIASSVMYARMVLLVAFFNGALALRLAPWFGGLAVVGGVTGLLVARQGDGAAGRDAAEEAKNPLELRAAFLFAVVFVLMLVLTGLARAYLGRGGLYALGAVMGVTDVDPFILGLTQGSSAELGLGMVAAAIVIAAASNNVAKAIYAGVIADRQTGRLSLMLLLGLAALGLLPVLFV
jgi:uncharacterized membrane protein (DUF4010 family)